MNKKRYWIVSGENSKLVNLEYYSIQDTALDKIIECSDSKFLKLINQINKNISKLCLRIDKLIDAYPDYKFVLNKNELINDLVKIYLEKQKNGVVMEEKERYSLQEFGGDNWEIAIVDNKLCRPLSFDRVKNLLNQQDKRIKELEIELENYKLCRCVNCSNEYEYGLETIIDELEKENQQLKEQNQKAIEQLEKVYKVVEYYNCEANKVGDYIDTLDIEQYIKELIEENKKLKQSQNQLAIVELKKVKENLVEDRNNAQVLLDPIEQEDYHELIGVICGYRNSIYEVQKQIKELGDTVNEN